MFSRLLVPTGLVHRYGTFGLASKHLREELKSQADVDGNKDIRSVHHHGDNGNCDGVEHGLFPGLQDVAAGDQEILEVQPIDVIFNSL